HRNHIVPHWLDYIKSLSKESPVIVVQNKIDQDNVGSRALKNQEEFRDRYKVEDFRHVSAEEGDGIADLQKRIGKVIHKMPEWRLKMPASWHKTRELVREKVQSHTDISQEEFQAICEDAKVRKVSRPSLLRYLHDTGVLYFNEHQFHGRIILDQEWVIQAIYSLFDREKIFWEILREGGKFNFIKLHKYLKAEKGFKEAESRIALSFMLSAEICYQLNNPDTDKGEEAIFAIPHVLPSNPIMPLRRPKENSLYFRYVYSYLHQVFIHRLIVRAGKLALADHVWQNGIQFYWGGTFVVVEAIQNHEGQGGSIQIQISGDKQFELLKRLQKEFEEIHPQRMNYRNIISLDGHTWVDLKKLEDARKGDVTSILCEAGNGVTPQNYGVFFGEQKIEGGVKDLEPEALAPISPQLIEKWKSMIIEGDLDEVISMLKPYAFQDDKLMVLLPAYSRFRDKDILQLQSDSDLKTKYNDFIYRLMKYFDRFLD
ncbi:MAG: COR domain-containing protein, partial [Bacteroidota bacterium]